MIKNTHQEKHSKLDLKEEMLIQRNISEEIIDEVAELLGLASSNKKTSAVNDSAAKIRRFNSSGLSTLEKIAATLAGKKLNLKNKKIIAIQNDYEPILQRLRLYVNLINLNFYQFKFNKDNRNYLLNFIISSELYNIVIQNKLMKNIDEVNLFLEEDNFNKKNISNYYRNLLKKFCKNNNIEYRYFIELSEFITNFKTLKRKTTPSLAKLNEIIENENFNIIFKSKKSNAIEEINYIFNSLNLISVIFKLKDIKNKYININYTEIKKIFNSILIGSREKNINENHKNEIYIIDKLIKIKEKYYKSISKQNKYKIATAILALGNEEGLFEEFINSCTIGNKIILYNYLSDFLNEKDTEIYVEYVTVLLLAFLSNYSTPLPKEINLFGKLNNIDEINSTFNHFDRVEFYDSNITPYLKNYIDIRFFTLSYKIYQFENNFVSEKKLRM